MIELAYAQGIGESWNAGGCCVWRRSTARTTPHSSDLIATVDPGHGDPVYLAGYSNGGRMAYMQGMRLAFATYASGSHLWPAGDATTPSAANVIERFFGVG